MEREKINAKQLLHYIEELIGCGALELIRSQEPDGKKVYVPYMMNDAVEYYLILTSCKIAGHMPKEIPEKTFVQSVENDLKSGIIFGFPDGAKASLWYEDCEKIMELYQYHRIGHFWVKGQEQWRQLVYMVGTIFDKYAYLGEGSCNEEEQKILPLITFAPFRYWTPVGEDLESRYPDAYSGILCMQELTREAGDKSYSLMTRIYGFLFRIGIPMGFMDRILASALTRPGRIDLYELIFDKVCKASLKYPQRDYGETLNREIHEKRCQTERELHKQGFAGQYPFFKKEGETILAAEEHPFTVLESENFSFRIQLMVSKVPKGENRKNAGFFKGVHRKSSVVS